MTDWLLRGETDFVTILKQGVNDPCVDEKSIYTDHNIGLQLLYYQPFRSQAKLLGYKLKFKNKPATFAIHNAFGIIYEKSLKKVLDASPKIEVLYDDQAVRLLAYLAEQTSIGYLLVGRWRLSQEQVEASTESD